MNFLRNVGIKLVSSPLADGSTDFASDVVDMAGFNGVSFLGLIGVQAVAATAELKLQESDDGTNFLDVPGALVISPVNSDNLGLILDVYKPVKRFLRTFLIRGGTGNTTWAGTWALLYQTGKVPIIEDPSIVASTLVVSNNVIEEPK